MTRVVLDANLLISYLLNPNGDGPPAHVVRAAIAGAVAPIVSPRLLQELHQKVSTKPYLVERITTERLDRFVPLLLEFAELHDDADIHYPTITRDRKDDYLIISAVLNQAEYLVTGDQGLLVLGDFEGVRIITPAEFVEILKT